MRITVPEEVLDEFFRVMPMTCEKYPRRGIPCVSCSESQDCKQVEVKEMEFADGVMRRAGSSATLSARIRKQGDLDELLLKQLVKGFVEDRKYMLIEPGETFDVTFFISAERYESGVVTAQRQKKTLIRNVLEFLSSKPIEGRLKIHDWAKKEIDKFDQKVRREYKDAWKEIEEVVVTPPPTLEKVERSVSFAESGSLSQGPVVVTTGASGKSTDSPVEIIRFLKEDAEKGSTHAQKFKEATDTGRPLIPRPKAEEPLVEKEYLPRKAAIIEQLPPMPKGNPQAMLKHIETLVEADVPARFISDQIERVRDELRKLGYWSKAYLDMGSVSRKMFQYHEGLAISLSEKKQVLEKLKSWKAELKQ